VQFCKKSRPDLVVMDIGLPGLNGIEATIEILRHSPQTRVVILSIYDDENSVVSAIRSGARGFVLKRASSADLIDALRTWPAAGRTSVPRCPTAC
jgi:DNA-binding NarL/FixJ family response regulator